MIILDVIGISIAGLWLISRLRAKFAEVEERQERQREREL
jgi:hypothetical protein